MRTRMLKLLSACSAAVIIVAVGLVVADGVNSRLADEGSRSDLPFLSLLSPAEAGPDRPLPGEGKRPPVPPISRDEMDKLIEQKKQEAQDIKTAFLQEFVNGSRRYTDLPIANSDIGDFPRPPTLQGAVGQADLILPATATGIAFEMSAIAATPRSRVAARVGARVVKGAVHPGDDIELRYLGGPVRDPSGKEYFFQLQQTPVPRPGHQMVVLLNRTAMPGVYTAAPPWGRFDLVGGRVVATAHNPLSASVAGLTEDELLDRLAALARN